MARVLMIGIDPEEVDFSDPALPPGMNADKIRGGIAHSLEQMKAQGHVASQIYVSIDAVKLEALKKYLANEVVDVVTIGGGVTRPVNNVELLEAVLNIIVGTDPAPRIALVLSPENAPAAVTRVLR
jgi:hypothetical protein